MTKLELYKQLQRTSMRGHLVIRGLSKSEIAKEMQRIEVEYISTIRVCPTRFTKRVLALQ